MTRTSGSYRPASYLVRAGACTTKVAEVEAPAASDTVTLNYVVPSSRAGIYAIVFTSVELGMTGAYTYNMALD